MTAFIAIAALLTLLVLAIALRPLWNESRRLALGSGVGAAMATCVIYLLVGTPDALDARLLAAPATPADAIARLEAELERDERKVESWFALGRLHTAERNFKEARDAFVRAADLAPQDADVLVEAAQRRFDAGAIRHLESALRIEPRHERARWFLGVAHRQAGDPAKAALVWESLIGQVDAPTERALRTQIATARSEAGLPALAAPARGAHALRVHVEIADAVRVDLGANPKAAVYLLARAPGTDGMPSAVERHALSELPFDTTLDDDDSPMPTKRLSTLDAVDVIARVSMTGEPFARPDDPQSRLLHVRLPREEVVNLEIAARK